MKKPKPLKPEPAKRLISLRLATHIDEQVRAVAARKGMKPSAVIQDAISEYLEREPKG